MANRGSTALALGVCLAAGVGGTIAIVAVSCGRAAHEVPVPVALLAPRAPAPPPPAPPPPAPNIEVDPLSGTILQCADLEAAHADAVRSDTDAFTRALAAKNLTLLALEARPIGPFPDDNAPKLERDEPPWFERTEIIDGKKRGVLVGEVVDQMFGSRAPPELVEDARGDIWKVRRSPTLSPRESVEVEACAWGCWGQPPPGAAPPERHARDRWLLPAGHHYRGTLDVPYTTYGLTVIIVDRHCALPG